MFKPPDYVEQYIPLETPVPLKNQVNYSHNNVMILVGMFTSMKLYHFSQLLFTPTVVLAI